MSLRVFDPLEHAQGAADDVWPAGRETERAYIEGIAHAGLAATVPNVRTRWMALRCGDRVLPLTINHDEYGDSYVTQPHSAYIDYARQELDLVDTGRLRPLLSAAIGGFDRLLRAVDLNRIVHVDNWLLSTNLHGDWRGEGLAALRAHLVERFPRHFIAIRSIDAWSSPALNAELRADGWRMLPSRRIWVVDDLARDWRTRTSVRNDHRRLRASGLQVEDLATVDDDDAQRIAELYRQLYLDKYSALNPAFTAAYVRMAHAAGAVRYRVARADDGRIMAVGGVFARADVGTAPVVGYDTAAPRALGLYRIASLLSRGQAMARGLRFNGSAGAGDFKRARGAKPVVECTALYASHLPAHRRAAVRTLEGVLRGIVFPMMARRGL
jgi:hypothetical protein